eukprot:GHVL01003760.1.p1 GENE.GHVL01003760.1~~GHVL01003760.1.p1  ORF type:complete len:254 (+),score=36.01 GHVL01003760.1:450-1211(+)
MKTLSALDKYFASVDWCRQLMGGDKDDEVVATELAKGLKVRYVKILTEAIKELRCANKAKNTILNLQKKPFDMTNSEHKEKLGELWKLLKGDEPIVWKAVGFHGEPSSNFRGVGVLGLENILHFAKKHNIRAVEVLHNSRSEELYFPFAATSLNVTSWLLEWLSAKKCPLNVVFYNNPNEPLEIFSEVHSYVMLEFSRFWQLSRPKDIMQFGLVAEKFRSKIKEQISHLCDLDWHSEWGFNLSSVNTLLNITI